MLTYKDNESNDKVKVFFTVVDDKVSSTLVGNQAVPMAQGFQFYVDVNVANQIDKVELYLDGLTPKLRLKDGEAFEEIKESEDEKEIRELEERLKELKS